MREEGRDIHAPVLNPANAVCGASLHVWSSTVEGAACVPFGCASASWMRVENLEGKGSVPTRVGVGKQGTWGERREEPYL